MRSQRTVCFVVLWNGSDWQIVQLGEPSPEPVGLEEVLHAVEVSADGDSEPLRWVADGSPSLESGDGRMIAGNAWAGLIVSGRVVVAGSSGSWIELSCDDLRLIDDGARDRDRGPQELRRYDELERFGLVGTSSASEQVDDATVVVDPVVPIADPRAKGERPRGRRTPVYAVWQEDTGPLLSLGMLTAAARGFNGGALTHLFEIRRPEHQQSFLADVEQAGPGPAVMLCSNYVWSDEANLASARAAVAMNPQMIFVHGGPSTPKYERDVERFFAERGDVAHVLVRGEGEGVVCDLLEGLGRHDGALDRTWLEEVPGISFRDPVTGDVVRTRDRERIASLDDLPSPYLTGEFDHIDARYFRLSAALETSRGCPYRCSFCDWGSLTNSRMRRFAQDRVDAEIDWLARHGVERVFITDANFGMSARDVEVAARVAAARTRWQQPTWVSWTPAKNTTKHFIPILESLSRSGIVSNVCLGIQSFDAETLEAIDRSNISNDHFVELARDFRIRGLPLHGELMLGLPGQTLRSYLADLQHVFDLEVMVRSWPVLQLLNSPMNDPSYVEEHGIVIDADRVVRSTSSFTGTDRAMMYRIRRAFIVAETLGLIRHVLRWLQWDVGVPATEALERILGVASAEPTRFPSTTWVMDYFDIAPFPLLGWPAFYDEVERLVVEEFGVPFDDPGLSTVLRVERALAPLRGRSFPERVSLEHDFVSYYRDATASLYRHGHPTGPPRPLAEYGPGELLVHGDPLDLCERGLPDHGGSRDDLLPGEFYLLSETAMELDSSLTRLLPEVARRFPRASLERMERERTARSEPESSPSRRRTNRWRSVLAAVSARAESP